MEGLVSVIIPVYKVEEYLDRCVESVVSQTYKNLEIILVDDGSPDACPEICDRWRERDSRVKVIHKKNEGVGMARNTGLDIARGDYIYFLDSDDYLPDAAIGILIKRMIQDNSDLALGRFSVVFEDGHHGGVFYPWMSNAVLSRDSAFRTIGSEDRMMPTFSCGKLYRKNIFDGIRFNTLKIGEDLYILPHVIGACNTISVTSEVVYCYYQRSTSVMHSRTDKQIMDNIAAEIHVALVLLELGYMKGASRYYYNAVCNSLELEDPKKGRDLLKKTVGKRERKLCRKNIDNRSIKNVLMKKFPSLYAAFKSVAKRRPQ